MLIVSEIFGPTVQGEGPSCGRRCGFLRLGHCNLHCSWCDADYTWAFTREHLGLSKKVYDPAVELRRMSDDEIIARIATMDVAMLVVTGGEPLIQQRALLPLLAALRDGQGMRIEVETNGTITPHPEIVLFVDQFNVSPKLANSDNPLRARYHPDVLKAFQATRKVVFKFVVVAPADLEEIDQIVRDCGLTNVWVMPEGVDARVNAERLQAVVADVLARGYNISPRLQVQVWGNRRGV